MSGPLKATLLWLLPPAMLFLATAAADNGADDLRRQQQKLHRLQLQIEDRLRSIRRAQSERDGIQDDLRGVETEIGQIGRRLRFIHRDREQRQTRLEALENQAEGRQAALERERRRLARLLRSAWQIERRGDIRILLSQQNPAASRRTLTYHDYVARQRARQVERVGEKLRALAATRQALTAQTQTLARLQNSRERERAKLRSFKEQKQAVLARVLADIKTESGALERLRKDEQSLRAILSSLTELLADIPLGGGRAPFADLRGKLAWPAAGRLLTRYGARRGGSGKPWSGVFIGARRGARVTAVAPGRVAFSDWLRGYGLLLIIDHGDDYMTLYGHNESVFKDTGEWVESGDVIASVGDSGGQPVSGLYFEIRRRTKPLNPTHWCAARQPPREGGTG